MKIAVPVMSNQKKAAATTVPSYYGAVVEEDVVELNRFVKLLSLT